MWLAVAVRLGVEAARPAGVRTGLCGAGCAQVCVGLAVAAWPGVEAARPAGVRSGLCGAGSGSVAGCGGSATGRGALRSVWGWQWQRGWVWRQRDRQGCAQVCVGLAVAARLGVEAARPAGVRTGLCGM